MKTDRKRYTTTMMLTLCLVLLTGVSTMAQAQTIDELANRAQSAGIEESRIADLFNRAETRGISEDDLAGFLQPAIQMAEENLPYEMIFEKVFEGISKRVPANRIQPVLLSINSSASEASGFVDGWVDRPEIAGMLSRSGERVDWDQFRNEMIRASSKGLMQNFDRDVMESALGALADSPALQNARPSGIVTAISVMSDLPGASEDPAGSARIMISALESGFDAAEMRKLPGAMNMAQRRGQLPAQSVAEGLSRQLEGGLPASQVLQNLFNGEVGGGPPGGTPPGLDRNRPDRPGSGN
ncbi:MAG: hypothetical protein JJU46_07900 [Balneolaceae bacterium]|nr:hypothetical protein [Balneolaceae bacterium]MCH8549612.1 hypothetical protein [Balneolaceae bacterium]